MITWRGANIPAGLVKPDLRFMDPRWYVGFRLRVPARKPGQIREVPIRLSTTERD